MMGGNAADQNKTSAESQVKIRQLARPGLPETKNKPTPGAGAAPSVSEADQLADEEMD